MTGSDLTRTQLDILKLEATSWPRKGAKISAFRRLYPGVTETGYYVVLLALIHNPAAYECEGGAYADLLRRLERDHKAEVVRRAGLRSVPGE
jgi:hypothetical protein